MMTTQFYIQTDPILMTISTHSANWGYRQVFVSPHHVSLSSSVRRKSEHLFYGIILSERVKCLASSSNY